MLASTLGGGGRLDPPCASICAAHGAPTAISKALNAAVVASDRPAGTAYRGMMRDPLDLRSGKGCTETARVQGRRLPSVRESSTDVVDFGACQGRRAC